MYKILMLVQDETACSYYRAVLPSLHCTKTLRDEGIQLDLSETLNLDENHDCYIFHRLINAEFFPVLHDLKFNHKKKIVWDLDDNLFAIPEWSPATEMSTPGRKRCLLQSLEWADRITLTTERFRQQIASLVPSWDEKTVVLPNLIDCNDWGINSRIDNDSYSPIRFLWAGSLTHQKDIDLIGEVIQEIINENEENVQFMFVGGIPEVLKSTPGNVKKNKKSLAHIGTSNLLHYPLYMRLLRPDVALIPVLDCPFNEAKSNIKYLEMALAGAACIASDVGPYRDSIKSGTNGILAKNEKDWKDIINYLIDYPVKISDFHRNARENVIDYYSWRSPAKNLWLDFFRSLAQ